MDQSSTWRHFSAATIKKPLEFRVNGCGCQTKSLYLFLDRWFDFSLRDAWQYCRSARPVPCPGLCFALCGASHTPAVPAMTGRPTHTAQRSVYRLGPSMHARSRRGNEGFDSLGDHRHRRDCPQVRSRPGSVERRQADGCGLASPGDSRCFWAAAPHSSLLRLLCGAGPGSRHPRGLRGHAPPFPQREHPPLLGSEQGGPLREALRPERSGGPGHDPGRPGTGSLPHGSHVDSFPAPDGEDPGDAGAGQPGRHPDAGRGLRRPLPL